MIEILMLAVLALPMQDGLVFPPEGAWDAERDASFAMVSGVFVTACRKPTVGPEGPEYWFVVYSYERTLDGWHSVLCVAREPGHIKLCKQINRRDQRRWFGERVMVRGRLTILYSSSREFMNVILVEDMAETP